MQKSLLYICSLLCAVLFSLTSCSGRQDIVLENSGRGTTRMEIELHPFFVQYLRDLTAAFGDPLADPREFRVFDELEIARSFGQIEGLSLEKFERFAPGHIALEACFSDPSQVVPAPEGADVRPVLTFGMSRAGGQVLHTLELYLDSGNVQGLYGLLGVEEQQNMITFGPQPDPMSREEYIDMMSYALGTYAEESALRKILESQEIEISVRVEGTIVDGEGISCRGDTASLTLPFLQPATLEEPVYIRLTWRE
jgi:hypothetical protein